MPGKETELTARLKPARRQFFQWHLKEKYSLRTVKDKMDELTKALNAAGYYYNFIADVKSWKRRSRYWNRTAKKAWNVEPSHKGWDLSVPTELIDVPIWIQWDQDVGDWRSKKSKGKTQCLSTTKEFSSRPPVAQENQQNTGNWNTTQQISTLTEHCEALPDTNKPPYLSQSATYLSGITFPGLNTETLPWQQQGSNYLAAVADPPQPQPDQIRNGPQDHTRRPDTYCQTFSTATPAPNTILPLWNSSFGNGHDVVSYMNDTNPDHIYDGSWPWERPQPTARDYTPQGRTPYPHEYAQEPSGFDLHGQHESMGIAAGYLPGPYAPRRNAGQDGRYHYDSALR